MIKMLYNGYRGIYKFGNNTYRRCIGRKTNLGHIFWEKSASYGPGNMVHAKLCVFDGYDCSITTLFLYVLQFFFKFVF
jgi:hypothetical protein